VVWALDAPGPHWLGVPVAALLALGASALSFAFALRR
jgi:hypothetical protein